jgi:hypothetical protein
MQSKKEGKGTQPRAASKAAHTSKAGSTHCTAAADAPTKPYYMLHAISRVTTLLLAGNRTASHLNISAQPELARSS